MEITKVDEPVTAVRISRYPCDNKNAFLITGKSNVEKSSFINTLLNRKNFVWTSHKPCKTQGIKSID